MKFWILSVIALFIQGITLGAFVGLDTQVFQTFNFFFLMLMESLAIFLINVAMD